MALALSRTYEYGTGENVTIYGIPSTLNRHNSTYNYSVVLHGLDSFAIYSATVGVGTGSGCLDKFKIGSFNFQTPHVLTLSEVDQPYDSITQQGGGAQITWNFPAGFSARFTFASGNLTWANSSVSVLIPVTSGSEIATASPDTDAITLSLPRINIEYWVNVTLVYKQGSQSLTVTSLLLGFTYLEESTNDGLTNQEKSSGWLVDTPFAQGGYGWSSDTWVTANPNLYATNGLDSDYVEKWLGLDPNTIDTAHSHMLDTWNLTFDIQGHSLMPRQLADFQFWYENSTYNFSMAKPSPTVSYSSFVPLDPGATNLTDNSVWAAQVLWGYGALSTLESLIENESVGWLRAVEGSYDGLATITVWGKLSWGADPVTASTPNDGLPDGARVNPLYDEGLELDLGILPGGQTGKFGLTACGNVPSGAGIALSLSVPGGAQGALASYSSQFSSTCPNTASVSTYNITLPMVQTAQWQTVTLQMIANESTTKNPDSVALPINGCSLSYTLTIGMLNATPLKNSNGGPEDDLSGNPTGSCSGVGRVETITAFGASEVPYGVKAPTWLWVPTNNASLGNLPPGLQRYADEQDFALVVVNDTSVYTNAITSETIPFPWSTPIWNPSSGYTVSINPGLSNILVPRGQFFNSTLGRSLLSGTAYPQFFSTPAPLLGSNENASIVNFGLSNQLGDLSCYWQNRAIYTGGANTLGCSAFAGTSNRSADAISVMEDTNSSTTINGGGVPGDPYAETAAQAGAALQVVVRTGVNTTTQLDLLLAGLLDNSTGGVNGTLVPETYELPSLGFSSAVIRGLANQTYPSGGLWGVPASKAVAQTTGCGSIWSFVSNSPGGDLSCVVSDVVYWVGVAYSLATAASDYISNPAKLEQLGLQLDHRVESAVSTGGRILIGAWQGMVSAIQAGAIAVLTSGLSAIKTGLDLVLSGYSLPVSNAICGCTNGALNQIGPANAAVGTSTLGGGFSSMASYLNPIGTVLTIVLGILTVVTAGTATVVLFVVSLLISYLFSALSSQGLIPKSLSALTGPFGISWWTAGVEGAGLALNATLSFERLTLTGTEQQNFDTALGLYQSSADVGSALALYGIATGLNSKVTRTLMAGLSLMMAIVGAMMILYVYITTITNYQEGHAAAIGLAAMGSALAIFGLLVGALSLATPGTTLSPVQKLLIGVAAIFAAFDIFAGVAIISS